MAFKACTEPNRKLCYKSGIELMDLKTLLDTPPWEWPRDTGSTLLRFLTDPRASDSDRLIAADLAGDYVVINDGLADALLAIVSNANEPEELRAQAAISFGPVLEPRTRMDSRIRTMYRPLPSRRFIGYRNRSARSTSISALPSWCGGEFWKHRCALPRLAQ